MLAKRSLCICIGLICLVPAVLAQSIPEELKGTWVVRRELPTGMISCWGDEQAGKLLGTEIEYSAKLFRGKDLATKDPIAVASLITARQFHDEYSGQGAGSSDVTLKQVGINTGQARRVTIRHADANVSGSTSEIPGDDVLLKDQNTIIFSVCGVFFEAKRTARSSHTK